VGASTSHNSGPSRPVTGIVFLNYEGIPEVFLELVMENTKFLGEFRLPYNEIRYTLPVISLRLRHP
jgi:hypothetical protein